MRRDEMTVRFDTEERAIIDALAKQSGLSAAAVVRMLVRGASRLDGGPLVAGPVRARKSVRKPSRKAGGK
jgi:hypothetical protein